MSHHVSLAPRPSLGFFELRELRKAFVPPHMYGRRWVRVMEILKVCGSWDCGHFRLSLNNIILVLKRLWLGSFRSAFKLGGFQKEEKFGLPLQDMATWFCETWSHDQFPMKACFFKGFKIFFFWCDQGIETVLSMHGLLFMHYGCCFWKSWCTFWLLRFWVILSRCWTWSVLIGKN